MGVKWISGLPESEEYVNHSSGNIISCPNCVETSQRVGKEPANIKDERLVDKA